MNRREFLASTGAAGNDVSILSGVLTNLAAHFRKQ